MSEIRFSCPKCDRKLQINSLHAGALVACPQCGESVTVPQMAVTVTEVARVPRPTSVTVFAILNIIFGSLGLLGSALSLLGTAMAARRLDTTPALSTWQMVFVTTQPMAAVLLLCTGIGLLSCAKWARLGSLIYACFSILLGIGYMVVTFDRFLALARESSSEPSPEQVGYAVGTVCGGTCVGSLIWLVYPILLIIFMTRPKVVSACR